MAGKPRYTHLTYEFFLARRDTSVTAVAREVGCKTDTIRNYMRRVGFDPKLMAACKTTRTFAKTADCVSFIDGLLMGDASLRSKPAHTMLVQETTSEVWRNEIVATLAKFDITTTTFESRGAYCYRTRAYTTFRWFYRRWYYEDGRRRIPTDVRPSASFLRQWLFSDGSASRGGVVFCCERFPQKDKLRLAAAIAEEHSVELYPVNGGRLRAKARFTATLAGLCKPLLNFGYKMGVPHES